MPNSIEVKLRIFFSWKVTQRRSSPNVWVNGGSWKSERDLRLAVGTGTLRSRRATAKYAEQPGTEDQLPIHLHGVKKELDDGDEEAQKKEAVSSRARLRDHPRGCLLGGEAVARVLLAGVLAGSRVLLGNAAVRRVAGPRSALGVEHTTPRT
jgi:hypothetical protein